MSESELSSLLPQEARTHAKETLKKITALKRRPGISPVREEVIFQVFDDIIKHEPSSLASTLLVRLREEAKIMITSWRTLVNHTSSINLNTYNFEEDELLEEEVLKLRNRKLILEEKVRVLQEKSIQQSMRESKLDLTRFETEKDTLLKTRESLKKMLST